MVADCSNSPIRWDRLVPNLPSVVTVPSDFSACPGQWFNNPHHRSLIVPILPPASADLSQISASSRKLVQFSPSFSPTCPKSPVCRHCSLPFFRTPLPVAPKLLIVGRRSFQFSRPSELIAPILPHVPACRSGIPLNRQAQAEAFPIQNLRRRSWTKAPRPELRRSDVSGSFGQQRSFMVYFLSSVARARARR